MKNAFFLALLMLVSIALVGCPDNIQTPNVVGLSYFVGASVIVNEKLTVGAMSEEYSDTVPPGQIISQNPKAGERVALATPVAVRLSRGPATGKTVSLPGNQVLEMEWVAPGDFLMGSPATEVDRDAGETQHEVTLTSGFWMGKYEVTKAQWTAVMGTEPWANQSYVLSDTASPAVYISWDETQAFLAALNAYTGERFRLPWEAEWEAAYRAGATTRFYWGDDPNETMIGNYAFWDGNTNASNEQYAHVVGGKLPNARNLYDMSGNAWEWCQDFFAAYSGAAETNPTGPITAAKHVVRGGGWGSTARYCRAACRIEVSPGNQESIVGFRIAQ